MDNILSNPLNIAVISDIFFGPHFIALVKSHFGEETEIFTFPCDIYNNVEYKNQLAKCDTIIIWLNFESLFSNVHSSLYQHIKKEKQIVNKIVVYCEKLYANLFKDFNTQILWFLFEDFFSHLYTTNGYKYNSLIDRLNMKLYEKFSNSIHFIDLKHIIAEVGISNSFDLKGKYRWNAPYSKALIDSAAREIYKQHLIAKGITRKCLVLDCDNVLWGGIISEDGIENIKLGSNGFGRAYQDFQRFVLSLYHHGVILAICSKNEFPDIMIMFRKHSEMVLKEKHIACFEVNWGNKPDNIKRIAKTLNIGLDSIVFVDDSAIEIEAVKAMLPEVTSILYERDIAYKQFSCFNLKSNANKADIEKRNETYRTNQAREMLKSQYDSYADYINSLEIKFDIHEALPIEYSRISELTQRTNKCTNGIRYTVTEIKERNVSENGTLYSLSVSDRFSDLGLVGALEINGDTLTLFSLSCRALGREIEGKLLDFIADKHQITSIKFKSTSKNENLKTLLLKTFPNAVINNNEIP